MKLQDALMITRQLRMFPMAEEGGRGNAFVIGQVKEERVARHLAANGNMVPRSDDNAEEPFKESA